MKYGTKKKNIGILGGTFDPPHEGHIKISHLAISSLGLEEIWWVISLANPLKKKNEISNYEKRVVKVKKIIIGKKILLYDVQKSLKSSYAIDNINYFKKKYSKVNFVWIMGVDNIENFHKWKDWKSIFKKIPIAVFNRPFYSTNLFRSKSFNLFKKYRILKSKSKKLKSIRTPSWVFINGWVNYQSSTNLKSKKNHE